MVLEKAKTAKDFLFEDSSTSAISITFPQEFSRPLPTYLQDIFDSLKLDARKKAMEKSEKKDDQKKEPSDKPASSLSSAVVGRVPVGEFARTMKDYTRS